MSQEATKQGWVSLHRSMLSHPFWHGEKFTKGQAWVDLILNANHKENKVMIKGRLITVERGEQIRSQVTLAKTWKWNPRTVNKFLELLKSESMITTKSTELTTHITICNYSTFQDTVKNSAEQTTQHTTEQSAEAVQSRVQTNNNDNNINNDNNELKDLFDSFWQNYPKKSDKKKAETAFNRLPKTKKQLAIIDCKTRYSGTDKKYIPLATTYINGHRWDDEKEVAKPADKHNGFAEKNYQDGATDINTLEWMK